MPYYHSHHALKLKFCCNCHKSSCPTGVGLGKLTTWLLLLSPYLASGWTPQGSCRPLKTFPKQCSSSSSTHLNSSIFFDDDLGWDEEHDIENEFDVEYQGNALNDASTPDILQDRKRDSNAHDKEKSMDLLDDTDEFYYEKLFEEQSYGASKEEEVSDTFENDEQEPEITQDERRFQEAEQEYQRRKTEMEEWKLQFQEFQQESLRLRQTNRIQKKRQRLQERASFLALRALRPPKFILDDASKHERRFLPQPTLSLSSARNYLRREDLLQDDESLNLEQKLHGERYKNALGVYTRLLMALDEMQMQSQEAAKDLISEKVEREVESLFHNEKRGGKETHGTSTSSTVGRDESLDEVMMYNRRHQARMTTIVHLSLHQESNSIHQAHHDKEIKMPVDVGMMKLCRFNSDQLDSIPTHDLQTVLHIRGNMKRRGRLPKARLKIISQLQQSFLRPLF